MSASFEEVIRLIAKDETAGGVRSANSAISRLKSLATFPLRVIDQATAPLRSVWGLLQQIGLASMGITAIIDGVKRLTEPAVSFETAFTKIAALTTSSAADMEVYRKGIDDVARLTGRSDVELANAVFFIASAGLKGADAINTLTASAKASAAGLGDTKVVADAVTSALNAYKLSSTEATHVTDLLTNAVVQGKMEPAALAGSLGRILPMASAAGVSLEQVMASMATMTRVGLDADEAATSLRGTLNALEKPGTAAKDALDSIGLSADSVRASIRQKGLLATLDDLMNRTHGNIDVLGEIIPNVRALVGVLATAGSQSEAYAEILGSMNEASGKTDSAFEIMTQTTKHWIDVAAVAWDQLLEAGGSIILPILVPALQAIAKWMRIGQDIITAFTYDAGAMGLALTHVGDLFDEDTKSGVQPFFQAVMVTIYNLQWLGREISNKVVPVLQWLFEWLSPKLQAALNWLSNVGWPTLTGAMGIAGNFIDQEVRPRIESLYNWLYTKMESAISWWSSTAWPSLQKTWEAISAFVTLEIVPKLVAIYDWVYPKIQEAIDWAVNVGWPTLQKAWDDMQSPKALSDAADQLDRVRSAFEYFIPALDNLRETWSNLQKLDANWLYIALAPVLIVLGPLAMGLYNVQTELRIIAFVAELVTGAIRRFTDLLVWFKEHEADFENAFSRIGTVIHGIATDINSIVSAKLPDFGSIIPNIAPENRRPILSGSEPSATVDNTSNPIRLPPVSRSGGGWINEPVVGVGMRTGRQWSFAERKPEYVSNGGGGPAIIVQAGAVQISGAAGPAQGWADAADALWSDLHGRLRQSLEAQGGL